MKAGLNPVLAAHCRTHTHVTLQCTCGAEVAHPETKRKRINKTRASQKSKLHMATPYPEPFDFNGDINVHALGGFSGTPVQMRESGHIINISAAPLFFEIPDIGFRRALAAHPTDSMARMLPKMTPAECAAVPMTGAKYIIWDETDGGREPLLGGVFWRYQ